MNGFNEGVIGYGVEWRAKALNLRHHRAYMRNLHTVSKTKPQFNPANIKPLKQSLLGMQG